jgi:Spy/CpxP family protein refolding chaperone
MKTGVLCLCMWLSMTAGVARAQQQPGDDRFGRYFFSPELVMQNEELINVSDDQRADLKKKIRDAQNNFNGLQWQLQDQIEKLISVIKQPHPDEHEVMMRLQRVLDAEGEIKRTQLRLLVRIKNALTSEQQAKLEEVRNKPPSR